MQANHHCIFSTLSYLEHGSLNHSTGKKPHQRTQKTPQTKRKPKSRNYKTKPNPKTLKKKNCLNHFVHKQLFRDQQKANFLLNWRLARHWLAQRISGLEHSADRQAQPAEMPWQSFGWVSYRWVFKLAPPSSTHPNTPVQVTSLAKPKTKPQKTGWNIGSHPHPFCRHWDVIHVANSNPWQCRCSL